MENNKNQENSKIKSINMRNNFPNSMQEKIIRSKSKNMYPSKKIYKSKNSNKYPNPKPVLNNNKNIINNCQIEKPDPSYLKKDYLMKKNSQSDLRQNKLDLIELKKLNQENISLKETLIQQEHLLKELHDLFIHNYNKINSLRKKYSKYKHYLKYTIYGDSEEQLMKEKYEEEYALRAVEQQIMDEICPNPDKAVLIKD